MTSPLVHRRLVRNREVAPAPPGGTVTPVPTWAALLAAEAGAAAGAEYKVLTGAMAGNWTKLGVDANGHSSDAFWPDSWVLQGIDFVQDLATSTFPLRYDTVVGDVPADIVDLIANPPKRGWSNTSSSDGLWTDSGGGILQGLSVGGTGDNPYLRFFPDFPLAESSRMGVMLEIDAPDYNVGAGVKPLFGGAIRLWGNSDGRMLISGTFTAGNKFGLTYDGVQGISPETIEEQFNASLPPYWRIYGLFEGWGIPVDGPNTRMIWSCEPAREIRKAASIWNQVRAADFGAGGTNQFDLYVFGGNADRNLRIKRVQAVKIGPSQ